MGLLDTVKGIGGRIVNIGQDAATFLQSGKAPTNCPAVFKAALEQTNHLASKKFFIVMVSFVLLSVMYYSSIFLLFCIPATFTAHVAAYVTLFTESIKIFGLIIASFLGVDAIANFGFNSSSVTNFDGQVQNSQQTENQNINETQHIIEEGQPGAPEIRPYSQNATEEY